MPLTGTGAILGAALKAAVDSVPDKQDRDAVFQAMGEAIVAHIVANAVVVVTAGAGSPGGGNLA